MKTITTYLFLLSVLLVFVLTALVIKRITVLSPIRFEKEASSITKTISRQYIPAKKVQQDPASSVVNSTNMNVTKISYQMINASNTIYFLKHSGQTVNAGDYFTVVIEARDNKNHQTLRGGDFWYPALRSSTVNTAGKIKTDFNNGTYECIFYAPKSGNYSIEIILVHPSETVAFIENKLWPMEDRVMWNGNFSSNQTYEIGKCGFGKRSGNNSEKCVYSFPLAMGSTVFLCSKPTKPSLNCDSLSLLKSRHTYIERKFTRILRENNGLYHRSVTYARIYNGPENITVKSQGNVENIENQLKIPDCRPDLHSPVIDGFWVNNIWTSLHCKTKQWSKDEIKQCVKGKRLYFLGDSTTRQWNGGLLDLLGLGKSKSTHSPHYRLTYHYSNTVNMTYVFHPFTLGSVGCPYRNGRWEYEILDNLNTTVCNYIIVLSPWAHYTQWVKERYIDRLYLLRETVLRLRERCPNTIFVVKTPKPRNHDTKTSLLYTGDRLIYDIRSFFLEIFGDFGIHIVDVWDMNLAYPATKTIHMPKAVIQQELYMFLSHIC